MHLWNEGFVMNQQFKDFLNLLEKELPAICSDGDLIKHGIFGSVPSASRMRSDKSGPNYLRLGSKKVRYLKADVLNWVSSRYHSKGEDNVGP